MTGRNVNRDNLLAVKLLHVRRHFNGCKKCRSARSARAFDNLCEWAKLELIEVAVKWDNNIPQRLAARNSTKDHVFPCPDPNAHGAAYALTAEPVVVVAMTERLF